MILKTQDDTLDPLVISNCVILWLVYKSNSILFPCYVTPRPAMADPAVSVRNAHTLTAVGESDSFLCLPPLSLSSPLYPLLF